MFYVKHVSFGWLDNQRFHSNSGNDSDWAITQVPKYLATLPKTNQQHNVGTTDFPIAKVLNAKINLEYHFMLLNILVINGKLRFKKGIKYQSQLYQTKVKKVESILLLLIITNSLLA